MTDSKPLSGSAIGYKLIDGRRWRSSDPSIPKSLYQQLVNELMSARRSVASALKSEDVAALKKAKTRVQQAKVALGERGPKWWLPLSGEELAYRARMTLMCLLASRPQSSLCPSEVARVIGNDDWRNLMATVRDVAWAYQREGIVQVTQGGNLVERGVRGAIRLEQGPNFT